MTVSRAVVTDRPPVEVAMLTSSAEENFAARAIEEVIVGSLTNSASRRPAWCSLAQRMCTGDDRGYGCGVTGM